MQQVQGGESQSGLGSDVSLEDELNALLTTPQIPLRMCRVAHVLSLMTEQQRELFVKLLDEPLIPAPNISKTLERHGYLVPSKSISRHRRRFSNGGCACQT